MQTFRTECKIDSPFSWSASTAIIHMFLITVINTTLVFHVVYCSWENEFVKTSPALDGTNLDTMSHICGQNIGIKCSSGFRPSSAINSSFPQDTSMKIRFGNNQLINISFCITRWHQCEESVAHRLENASGGILLILYNSVNTVMAFLTSHFDSSKHLKWNKFKCGNTVLQYLSLQILL